MKTSRKGSTAAVLSRLLIAAVVFMLAVAGFGGGTAQAAPTVTNCVWAGPGGLQAALSLGGTVTFACDGTIVVPEIVISSDTVLDATGHKVTLSGNNANRVMTVNSGVHLTVRGLTLANGSAPGSGGAIFTHGGHLVVERSVIENNRANPGNYGGGLAVEAQGSATITDSTIRGNTARAGGGLYFGRSPVTIERSTFSGNTASDATYPGYGADGGAIAFFVGNPAGSLTIKNSTISGNTATSTTTFARGGGLYVQGNWSYGAGSVELVHTTFAGNTAKEGAGIAAFIGQNQTKVHVANTIVADGCLEGDDKGVIVSDGYNVSANASCNFTQATDQQNTNPQLEALAGNGGPTQTHALRPNSKAIDVIPSGSCPVTTDQRGYDRPYPAGGQCDVGAYEAGAGPVTGTIKIVKDAFPDTNEAFGFVIKGGSFPAQGQLFGVNDGATYTLPDLAAGQYRVQEVALIGWTVTAIRCDDGNSTGDLSTATATINLEGGETVTCSFTNDGTGSITVVKDAQPDSNTDFGFALIGPYSESFLLIDNGGTSSNNTKVLASLPIGQYALIELIEEGWDATDITCTGASDASTDVTRGRADINLKQGENVTCTFVNMPEQANPTTTSVAGNPNPADYGTAVDLTATVSSSAGTPTGDVQFYRGACDDAAKVAIGGPVALSGGQATVTGVTFSQPGTFPICAVYGGTSTAPGFAASQGSVNQVVSAGATTTSLTFTPDPAGVMESVVLRAVVSSAIGAPNAGKVEFFQGGCNGTPIGGPVAVTNGVAQLTNAFNTAGSYNICAVYSGGAPLYQGSNDTETLVVEVKTFDVDTSVGIAPNPQQYSDSVKLTANLLPAANYPLPLVGSVQFYIAGSPAGAPIPVSLTTNGTVGDVEATVSLPGVVLSEAAGTYPVTAEFTSNNAYFVNGTNVPTDLVVEKEDAVIYDLTHPALVEYKNGGHEAFQISGKIKEASESQGNPGPLGQTDITGVRAVLTPGTGSPTEIQCSLIGFGGNGYGSYVEFSCDVPANTLGESVYEIGFVVDSDYYTASFRGDSVSVVTVADITPGKAVGGGTYYVGDQRYSFGLIATVKYNRNKAVVQGNLVVIHHLADGGTERMKSNAFSKFRIAPDGLTATFSGKANNTIDYNNYKFSATVYDGGVPGAGVDTFDLSYGGPVFSTNGPVPLSNGNITVMQQ